MVVPVEVRSRVEKMDDENGAAIAGAVVGIGVEMMQAEEEQMEAFMMAVARVGAVEIMRLEEGEVIGKYIESLPQLRLLCRR